MPVKKTIAIAGATNQKGKDISKQLAKTNSRILLISNDAEALSMLEKEILTSKPKAELETLNCFKEGCWEADIVLLLADEKDMDAIISKIKEVSTQKTVIYSGDDMLSFSEWRKKLPNSTLVKADWLGINQIQLTTTQPEALNEAKQLFLIAGFTIFENETSKI